MIAPSEVGSSWKRVPWEAVFAKKVVGDRIFLRSALVRKELLPLYCGRHMPLTYASDSAEPLNASGGIAYHDDDDDDDALAVCLSRWVIKPVDSSNANGVAFFESEAAARAACGEGRSWVVQHAVPCSRALQGHKFHIRSLLLLVGDLDGYVYDESRVLVAPIPMTCCDDDHALITNMSFNADHAAYDESRHNLSLAEALPGDMGKAVSRRVRDIAADLCRSLADHADASRERKTKRHFFALDNTWELFGLDLMLDVKGRVVLLEANPEPSMGMWATSKAAILRGMCPVTQGVPRSTTPRDSDASTPLPGFTKVYSKRLDRALRAAKQRRHSSSESPPPSPR